MSEVLAYTSNVRCLHVAVADDAPSGNSSNYSGAGSSGAVTINSSVGMRSTNMGVDVTNIQKALNRIQWQDGGTASKPLTPDGICGPKTIEAIRNFQYLHFGMKGADGKINPGGETITKINEILKNPSPPDPKFYPPDAPEVSDFNQKLLTFYVAEARQWVREARMELMAVEPFIDNLDDTSESYRRLERIFAISQATNKRRTIGKILQVYNDMERAFQLHDSTPGGIFLILQNQKKPDPYGAVIAFTTGAGLYQTGAEINDRVFGRISNNKIYFVPTGSVSAALKLNEGFTFVLVHELAHYVGGFHSVGTIEDWDYQGSHAMRLRSANCYNVYAESVHNRQKE